MTDKKKPVSHLRSAREWIQRAEESYDKNHSIRGELNLLLAKAELQHVEETNATGKQTIKFKLLKHALAFCLAFLMVSAGIGGAYWWQKEAQADPAKKQETVITTPAPVLQTEVVAKPQETFVKSVPQEEVKANQSVTNDPPVASAARQTPVSTTKNNTAKLESGTDAQPVLSSDEMQKLVRAAGKSLRGQ